MISFSDIYQRAINLIDDPDISRAYANNPIEFKRIMYNFLVNGVSIITAPTAVCDALALQTAPIGKGEEIIGTGVKEYTLTIEIPEGADIMVYTVDAKGRMIVDYDAEVKDGKVTFSKELPNDSKALVEYYSDGSFDADFSNITKKNNVPAASLEQRVIDMLARATVISWADKEKNFLLDIRNLLNDTDFKLHSPANSTKSKVEWVADLRNEIFNLQNKLSWDMRNRARSRYGY